MILAKINPAELTARELLHVLLTMIVDHELMVDGDASKARDQGLRQIAAIPEQARIDAEEDAKGNYTRSPIPGLKELPEG